MAEANDNLLRVRLVTPDRILVAGTARSVELPTKTGYIEVLPGHAPLLSELGEGNVTLHGLENDGERYFVARGFVEVLPERVTILAETALLPQQIDATEAEQQLAEGEALWNKAGDEAEKFDAANDVIREAEAKLESAEK
ncbi:MAG: ATP synthase F1 subunit epsilon [Acidobacteriaceae bacterium]